MIWKLKKLSEPLSRRIGLMIDFCKITITYDKRKTQSHQCSFQEEEIHDDCEFWGQYGLSSFPPKNSEGVALFLGGERENPVIISSHHKDSRKTNLNEGEVSLYSKHGSELNLKRENQIEIKAQYFEIKNDDCRLISLISELLETLAQEKVNTMMGPQPLLSFAKYKEMQKQINSFIKEN